MNLPRDIKREPTSSSSVQRKLAAASLRSSIAETKHAFRQIYSGFAAIVPALGHLLVDFIDSRIA